MSIIAALKLLDEHLAAALDTEHCLHKHAFDRDVMIDLREKVALAISECTEDRIGGALMSIDWDLGARHNR